MNEERNVAQEEKKVSFWDKEIRLTVKDILLGLAAPVLAFAGVRYTADKRLEEKQLELEVAKVNADAQIKVESIRQVGRMHQLELITKAQEDGELPDTYSLKVLNENNK